MSVSLWLEDFTPPTGCCCGVHIQKQKQLRESRGWSKFVTATAVVNPPPGSRSTSALQPCPGLHQSLGLFPVLRERSGGSSGQTSLRQTSLRHNIKTAVHVPPTSLQQTSVSILQTSVCQHARYPHLRRHNVRHNNITMSDLTTPHVTTSDVTTAADGSSIRVGKHNWASLDASVPPPDTSPTHPGSHHSWHRPLCCDGGDHLDVGHFHVAV